MQSFQHYSSGGFSCKPLALILPPTESQHLPQNLNQIKKLSNNLREKFFGNSSEYNLLFKILK
jgi:hypothetical protein